MQPEEPLLQRVGSGLLKPQSRILTANGCQQRCAGLAVEPICAAVHAPPLLSKACTAETGANGSRCAQGIHQYNL
jgi:hypothetical protein